MDQNTAKKTGKHQKTFFELLSLPLYGVGELERLLEPE
jgi:hypothetical protein